MTNAKISSIKFENKDIINAIKALDPCKAHEYDGISVRMLKICDSSIVKPLTLTLMIHVSTSFYLLLIPYTKLLMLTLLLIQEAFFWISPKLLTKFGMKG